MAFKKTMNSIGVNAINAKSDNFGVGSRFNFAGKLYVVIEAFDSDDSPMRRVRCNDEQELFSLAELKSMLESGTITWS